MRVAVAIAATLLASPAMACDWLCQDGRRERAQLQQDLSDTIRQMETNRRLRGIEDEVRKLRSEQEWQRINDDYWRDFDARKRRY